MAAVELRVTLDLNGMTDPRDIGDRLADILDFLYTKISPHYGGDATPSSWTGDDYRATLSHAPESAP
jgi:hypothetical protein